MRPQFPQGEMEGKRSSPKGRPSLSRGTRREENRAPIRYPGQRRLYLMSRKNVRQESMWGKALRGLQEFALRCLSEEIQGRGGGYETGYDLQKELPSSREAGRAGPVHFCS